MSGYPNRVPPIKLVFDTDYYNMIIQVLRNNEKIGDENIQLKATKLKEKLLTYSVPREDENNIEVDVRLYNNEASQIIYQLMYFFEKDINVEEDYFSALKTIREKKFKKQEK